MRSKIERDFESGSLTKKISIKVIESKLTRLRELGQKFKEI